jgi:glycosyltransferase involved in cell wall biosynthesis
LRLFFSSPARVEKCASIRPISPPQPKDLSKKLSSKEVETNSPAGKKGKFPEMKIAVLTTDNRENFREHSKRVPYFGTAPEALLQGFAQLPEVEVHVLSCTRAPMQSPEKLAPNIYFHSLEVPRSGWLRSLYSGCVWAVRKKLAEIQPDIVHGQGTERDCAISAVFSGFPNVLTIHGNMRLIAKVNRARPFSFLWLAAKLEKFTVPRSAGVVCITHYTEEAVRDMARRTWVVPNAVDSSFFDLNAQPPADKPPRILCVGQVCLRKNQNAFIRALDPLAGQRKFELMFLGKVEAGHPYDDEFLRLVNERPWCVYGGVADRDRLKQCLRETRGLALPSLEDNCPMVVLEAMAAGVPVMAARVGGLPDLIEEKTTGFFCDPTDARSMSEALERVLTGGSVDTNLTKRAKEQALARFHPRVVAQKHLEIYREVLSTRS